MRSQTLSALARVHPICRVQSSGFRVPGSRLRMPDSGFRVQGFGFRVPGFGFRVLGSGLRVLDSGFRFPGYGFRVPGSGFWVSGFSFRVSGFVFRVPGSRFRGSDFSCRDSGFGSRVSSFGELIRSTWCSNSTSSREVVSISPRERSMSLASAASGSSAPIKFPRIKRCIKRQQLHPSDVQSCIQLTTMSGPRQVISRNFSTSPHLRAPLIFTQESDRNTPKVELVLTGIILFSYHATP